MVDRVISGEQLTLTRDGTAVALLIPLRRVPVSAAMLHERWAALPAVNFENFRRDIDSLIDQSVNLK